MQLHELATKQKRAHEWSLFIKKEVHSEDLRAKFVKSLSTYRSLLAKCWEQGEISVADLQAVRSAERELQDLDEQARLTNIAES